MRKTRRQVRQQRIDLAKCAAIVLPMVGFFGAITYSAIAPHSGVASVMLRFLQAVSI